MAELKRKISLVRVCKNETLDSIAQQTLVPLEISPECLLDRLGLQNSTKNQQSNRWNIASRKCDCEVVL